MTALQPRTREAVLQIASVAMMAAAVALWIGGSLTLPDALMAVVVLSGSVTETSRRMGFAS